MVHAHTAALLALADLLVLAHERRASCHVAEHQDHDVDAEEGVGHDSVLRAKQQGQDHASDSRDADQHEQNLEVERDGGHGLQTPTGGTFATARICFILWRWRYEGYGLRGRMSGLGLLLGALGLAQLRPDFLPVGRPQLLKARAGIDPVQPAGELWRCRLQSVEDLVEVLLIDRKQPSNLIPAFGGVVWECHAPLSTDELEHVK